MSTSGAAANRPRREEPGERDDGDDDGAEREHARAEPRADTQLGRSPGTGDVHEPESRDQPPAPIATAVTAARVRLTTTRSTAATPASASQRHGDGPGTQRTSPRAVIVVP